MGDRKVWLDKMIEFLESADQSVPAVDEPHRAGVASAPAAKGRNMGNPLRHAIRKFLQAEGRAVVSPDIARAMLAQGEIKDYKKGKMKVDATLKRMKFYGELVKDEDGWRPADLMVVAA
jgi:hypothetical protein